MINRHSLLLSSLCIGLALPCFAMAQLQPAPTPTPTPAPTPTPTPTVDTSPPIGSKAPVLDAADRLARKLNGARRRAKIFKISSLSLSSLGALGGLSSIIGASVVNDPDIQAAVGKIGGVSSLLSSGLGLLFGFEAKAGKNKDCLLYLETQTQQFTAKWTNGVPPERAAEFEADKDKIENGDNGKCWRLELR